MPLEAMIRKLKVSNELDQHDINEIRALPIQMRRLDADAVIVRERDRPEQCCLVSEGFLIRAKMTDRGKRQILSIHVPGDIPDLQSLHLHVMDHDLRTLSESVVGLISHEALRKLTRSRPTVAAALWKESLIDSAVFREWIVNLGVRPAQQRLAHFLLELRQRLTAIGRYCDETFTLPMTQLDLADALGMTAIHVNRVIQASRAEGLFEFRRNEVHLKDLKRLSELSGFDPVYLHQRADL